MTLCGVMENRIVAQIFNLSTFSIVGRSISRVRLMNKIISLLLKSAAAAAAADIIVS